MGDLISRYDAVKHIKTYRDEFKEDFGIDSEEGDDASHYFGYIAGLNRATRIIDDLPSAESETCEGCKHLGKWEDEITYGYPSPCTTCKRIVNDNYER